MKSVLKLFLCLSLVFVFSCDKDTIQEEPNLLFEDELTFDREDYTEVEGCETAFAFDKEAICFLDDDDLNSNRWGWSIGPLGDAVIVFTPSSSVM